jgi:hypothetical protein
MPKSAHLREVLLVGAALSIGWWAHSTRPVQAQSGPAMLNFEFSNIGPSTSLSLYSPADNTIYVYPIGVSNNRINCSFRVRLGTLGGPVNRENCPRGSLR